MSLREFSCHRCGHCCLTLVDAYQGCVSDADLELWRRAGRTDILARTDTVDLGHGNIIHYAWLDPETRDDVERCPWLQEASTGCSCTIEQVKPEHCRAYPRDRQHGQETGCPACTGTAPLQPSSP